MIDRTYSGGRVWRKVTIVLHLVAAFACPSFAWADPPILKPDGGPWPAGTGFAFDHKPDKTRRSVSGVACGAAGGATGQRVCLFAFDEGTEARFGVLEPGRLGPLANKVVLRAGGGELDAEAAALDRDMFYVSGSHSAKRSTCASNPDSRHVVRFRRDPSTGTASLDASGALGGYTDSGSRLWDLMTSLPGLAPHVGERKCLGTEAPSDAPELSGQRGVNIEGLAVANGRMTFGFRGPASGKRAPVLSVDAAWLFGDGQPHARLTSLEVGDQRGIRDLQAVAGGLLILIGPDDDEKSAGAGWVVAFWDGSEVAGIGKPRMLAQLDVSESKRDTCDKEIKPEAIAVVDERADAFEVVVLSDGMCDGGPMRFRVPR